jgi:site-specific recombinase XerD
MNSETNNKVRLLLHGAARDHAMDEALSYFITPYSSSSRITIVSSLRQISKSLGYNETPLHQVRWENIDADTVTALIDAWRGELSPYTVKLRLFAIRELLRCCMIHGFLDGATFREINLLKPPYIQEKKCQGHYIESDYFSLLMQSCMADERKTIGLRDQVMLILLFGAGLRRTEAVLVRRDDYNRERNSLTINNQRHETSIRYLPGWSNEIMPRWFQECISHAECGEAILQRVRKNGQIVGDLNANGLTGIFKSRCLLAKTPSFRPRDARQTRAMDLLKGFGLSITQSAMGHKNITTTCRYDFSREISDSEMHLMLIDSSFSNLNK